MMTEPGKDLGEHERYAQIFAYAARTPVLRRPSDIWLEHEEAFFPSLDDIPLE
jgi:hypothetical protein